MSLLLLSSTGELPATLQPIGIESNLGGWTDHLGSSLEADLVAAISEPVRDDSDYIMSPESPVVDVVTFAFQATPAQGDLSLTYSYAKSAPGPQMDITVKLLDTDGVSVLDSNTHLDVGTSPVEGVLSSTNRSAGTYYIEITANAP